MSGLVEGARRVVEQALETYAAQSADEDTMWALGVLTEARSRLDEPLRVALAGTLKSGKSTLLNAVVGERVAATDAGECTRVVTWYHDAPAPAVVRAEPDGRRVDVPFALGPDGLAVDPTALGEPEERTRLLVGWPSAGLAATTLIDTPGLDSTRRENSERTRRFVTPDDRPSGADVVVYLMRRAHPQDVDFLEAFADLAGGGAGGLGGVGAAGTVVVLARADEVGGGGPDALEQAERVARGYAAEDRLRPLCGGVVAVAGLLAETARTLRQGEYLALRALARAPREAVDAMLLTVDRFVRPELPAAVAGSLAGPDRDRLDAAARAALLDRLGVFGLRVAMATLRDGDAGVDSAGLAGALLDASGMTALRDVLTRRVTERADVFKARSALLAVQRVLTETPRAATGSLTLELEKVLAGAHEFAELRHCAALRSGAVAVPGDLAAEAERLLGADGADPRHRLGLADGTGPGHGTGPGDGMGADGVGADWVPVASEALARWRRRAESPLTSRAVAEISRAVVRSLEALVAPTSTPARGSRHVPF